MLISGNNVKGYAFFKAENGTTSERPSTSGVLDLEFIDPMKGLVGVTVPQWFLKSVTGSRVLGEIYLSLNDVNNTGKDDTVVLGTFAFNVRDSLVNQIESDIKVEYIRMFDDLRSVLELKVQQLQKDIGDTTSLVDSIKQTAQDAVTSINKATSDGTLSLDNAKNTAIATIDNERDMAVQEIDSMKTNVNSDYQTAVTAFKQNAQQITDAFNDNTTNANKTIDDKVTAFNQILDSKGFVTPAQVDSKLDLLNWQKYKLTKDNGTNFYDNTLKVDLNNGEHLNNLSIGTTYLANVSNPPNRVNANGWITKKYRDGGIGVVTYQAYNSNIIYQKRAINFTWGDWELLNAPIDTGWLPLNLINGVTSYSDTEIPSYRMINNNGIYTLVLKGELKNIIGRDTIVCRIPANIATLLTRDIPFVQNTSIKNGLANTARWVLYKNGDLVMERVTFDSASMASTDWYPISLTTIL